MDEASLIEAAQHGDKSAFGHLLAPQLAPLRSYLHRMVAHPEDAEDVLQETSIRAAEKIASFRGDASFKTWLFRIGTNLALNHLRTRKARWPETAQLEMHEKAETSEPFMRDMGAEMGRSGFRYEVAEHIAYCFSCVGRSLDPEESCAILLRDVFDFQNREAAKILEISESVFRHRVRDARQKMTRIFDGLCALVNQKGICHQCSQLRGLCPPDAQGPEPPSLHDPKGSEPLAARLKVVRSASLDAGVTSRLHGVMLRFIAESLD
jgi:RNA polymerase sigma-70 factor (ECF subfamily)